MTKRCCTRRTGTIGPFWLLQMCIGQSECVSKLPIQGHRVSEYAGKLYQPRVGQFNAILVEQCWHVRSKESIWEQFCRSASSSSAFWTAIYSNTTSRTCRCGGSWSQHIWREIWLVREGTTHSCDCPQGCGAEARIVKEGQVVGFRMGWEPYQPKPSTRVLFNGNLPTCLNWAGCQWVAKSVHLLMNIKVLILQIDNSVLSKSCIQPPMMCFWMFCSVRYRILWNPHFSFDRLYFCLSRWSIVLLYARLTVRCLDYQICKTKHCWGSVAAHFQDTAGIVSLLFLPLKAANITSMDVWNQSERRSAKMQI